MISKPATTGFAVAGFLAAAVFYGATHKVLEWEQRLRALELTDTQQNLKVSQNAAWIRHLLVRQLTPAGARSDKETAIIPPMTPRPPDLDAQTSQ